MKKWLRRIRGAVGMGLTWAAGWFGVGAIIGFLGMAMGVPGGLGLVVGGSLFYAGAGFLGGAAFSVILGITEGRRRFDQMSLPRFTVWGAMGGGLLSILYVVTLLVALGAQPLALAAAFVGLVTLLGAGSAAGSLALARMADDRELLEAGADVAEVGLTKEEKRELLGK